MNGLERVLIEQPKGALMFRYGIGSKVALASLIRWLDERLRRRVPDVAIPDQRLPADNPNELAQQHEGTPGQRRGAQGCGCEDPACAGGSSRIRSTTRRVPLPGPCAGGAPLPKGPTATPRGLLPGTAKAGAPVSTGYRDWGPARSPGALVRGDPRRSAVGAGLAAEVLQRRWEQGEDHDQQHSDLDVVADQRHPAQPVPEQRQTDRPQHGAHSGPDERPSPVHLAYHDTVVSDASESEAIREGLRALRARDQAVDAWLRDGVAEAYDNLAADPSRGVSAEELRRRLTEKRASAPRALHPEAEDHVAQLYRYIAEAPDPTVAARYVDAVIDYCEGLPEFPIRGQARDDTRPGLRTISYKKRTVIAFAIRSDDTVLVLGIFHGGHDYEAILSDPDSTPASSPEVRLRWSST